MGFCGGPLLEELRCINPMLRTSCRSSSLGLRDFSKMERCSWLSFVQAFRYPQSPFVHPQGHRCYKTPVLESFRVMAKCLYLAQMGRRLQVPSRFSESLCANSEGIFNRSAVQKYARDHAMGTVVMITI